MLHSWECWQYCLGNDGWWRVVQRKGYFTVLSTFNFCAKKPPKKPTLNKTYESHLYNKHIVHTCYHHLQKSWTNVTMHKWKWTLKVLDDMARKAMMWLIVRNWYTYNSATRKAVSAEWREQWGIRRELLNKQQQTSHSVVCLRNNQPSTTSFSVQMQS